MNDLILTERAERDIRDIHQFISEYNRPSADRVIRRLRQALITLADNPYLGIERNDVIPGLRSLSVNPYLIFYELSESGIEVARILHGSRDITRLF